MRGPPAVQPIMHIINLLYMTHMYPWGKTLHKKTNKTMQKVMCEFEPRRALQAHNRQVRHWHVWRSKNPINDLLYGYGGVKLFPKQALLDFDDWHIDFTYSASFKGSLNQLEIAVAKASAISSVFLIISPGGPTLHKIAGIFVALSICLLYTSPSPRD